MFNCLYATLIALIIYHEADAGKLTRQCIASQGRCGQTKDSTCESSFGSGWKESGKCCNRKPCCVSQCIPIDSLKNGSVTVTRSNDGLTAHFACDAGFVLAGNESLSCKSSVWHWDILQCVKRACPDTVAYFRGYKYTFDCSEVSRYVAHDKCRSNGGHLTSIESEDENDFILVVATLIDLPNALKRLVYWIGLMYDDNDQSYKWDSGVPFNYSDWSQDPQYPLQPDKLDSRGEQGHNVKCVALDHRYSNKWQDERCSFYGKYICKTKLT
ncbi:brevican core protein-like isoform X1 [Mytilus edulis]|uniref:brevican core protein-like isoform X1 n=1 Tax=Mytilus edulis TaxID=6550 RepID=UPI0039F0D162